MKSVMMNASQKIERKKKSDKKKINFPCFIAYRCLLLLSN